MQQKFTVISFPYGNSHLTARIPANNIAFNLKRKHSQGLPDENAALIDAIRTPVGSLPLIDRISKNDKVVVIVTDNTRACPDERLLPPILAELERKLERDNITIIIALGLHAPLTKTEMIEKLGKDIVNQYRVLNHDSFDVVSLGKTSRGTPVAVNRLVMEADFRISTGFIEPHFFAGFSGGSKSLSPGVSGPGAIYHNHGYEMIDHPFSRAGILKGNPIHEDIVEQAKMARLDFIVNVLLNEQKQITHVVAGDPVKAHEKGCEIETDLAGAEVDHKVDIVITTNSGSPLDLDLYQTVKGIDSASLITRKGGAIIIASCCNTGAGPDAFTRAHLVCSSPDEVLRKMHLGESGYLPWQNQRLAQVQQLNDIYLVSRLDAVLVKKMMMTPVSSIEEGLKLAFQKLGTDAEIAVIPEGPIVLPVLKS
jgi:lactate racemase